MKRMPIRIRFAVITSAVLAVCCLIITICVLNSAIMKLDSIEAGMINLSMDENTEIIMNLRVSDLFPEISNFVAEAKRNFIGQSIIITLGVILLGAAISFFTGKLVLKPIRDLSEAVGETTEYNLVEPLPLPEPEDEVRNLAEAFNTMKERLSKAFSTQKQFAANAAHELKTPLAVMQTGLEVFQKKESKSPEEYAEVVGTTLSQLDKMNHMIETLLTYQSMHTLPMEDTIIIAELAEEVTMDLFEIANEKKVDLNYSTDDDAAKVQTRGNTTMLYRAICNLAENAIKYNHEGGTVNIHVSTENASVTVKIADTGEGIPKDNWDKIFDAFYRVDKSRSRKTGGTGLGLAMVKEIADIHNGKVWVEKSDENGTVICFRIPAKP